MYFQAILLAIIYFGSVSTMETTPVEQFRQSLMTAYKAFDIQEEVTWSKDIISTIHALPNKNPHLFEFYAHLAAASRKTNSIGEQKMSYLLGLITPPLAGAGTILWSYLIEADRCFYLFGCCATAIGLLAAPKLASVCYEQAQQETCAFNEKIVIKKLLETDNPKPISTWLAVLHTSTQNKEKINAIKTTLRENECYVTTEFIPFAKKLTLSILKDEENPIATTQMRWNDQGILTLQ